MPGNGFNANSITSQKGMTMTTLPIAPLTLRAALFPRANSLTNSLLALGGAGFLAIMAQIAIPVPGSPVPVTGQTLGVLLIGASYGPALSISTVALYLAIGAAGAPIFSNGGSGFAKLVGPTGGYLAGMVLTALVLGYLANKKWDARFRTALPAMLIGEVLTFIPGLIWLQHATGKDWSWTVSAGFTPFILGEAIKISLAAVTLPTIWKVVDKRRS